LRAIAPPDSSGIFSDNIGKRGLAGMGEEYRETVALVALGCENRQ
jgi:hypothetical protein